MKVQCLTSKFRRSHLCEPRGRGSWAFEFEDREGAWFAVCPVKGPSLTYTEARRLAIAEARRRGVTIVEVLP